MEGNFDIQTNGVVTYTHWIKSETTSENNEYEDSPTNGRSSVQLSPPNAHILGSGIIMKKENNFVTEINEDAKCSNRLESEKTENNEYENASTEEKSFVHSLPSNIHILPPGITMKKEENFDTETNRDEYSNSLLESETIGKYNGIIEDSSEYPPTNTYGLESEISIKKEDVFGSGTKEVTEHVNSLGRSRLPEMTSEMLQVGAKFSSFADVKRAIEKFGEKTFTTFWKRDARTIASSGIVRPIESCLIYYQLMYACNHGGKKFKSSGQKIRRSWTFREDCPVHVRLKASMDGKSLEVTSFEGKHNHDTSKVLHANTPSQRRLPNNMKDYLHMKANQRMVQQKLQENTDKVITLQDLANITKSDELKNENLDNCINLLKAKYDAHVVILRDEDNHFRGLFIQTPNMKSTMNAFPEFFAVDATHRLLKIELPLFVMIVEDGNCQTEIVAVCILTSEDEENFTWFLETFKRENPAWINVKCIMTDKDSIKRDAIRNCLPDANLITCVFHTLKIFSSEISSQKLGITPSQRTSSLELIQKLVYAKTDQEYEEYLDGLKNNVPEVVYEYFMSDWNSNKDEWNLGKNYFKNNFVNNTNNCLESIIAKLKSVINKNSSLEHFVNSLFSIISTLETERDHKTIHGILKKPVDMFPDNSDEKNYFQLLTREAAKHVLREIRLSEQIKNINISTEGCYIITDSQGSTKTTTSSCDCVIHNIMILPCKHIFAVRRYSNMDLFDPAIVNRRWTMAYYKDKQPTLACLIGETEPESPSASASSNNSDTVSLTNHHRSQSLSTFNQRRKKCLLLCTELADLAAQSTGVLFDQKLRILENLKTLWANDVSVALTPIEDGDLDAVPCTPFIENVDKLSQSCNGVVIQEENEAPVIDEANHSCVEKDGNNEVFIHHINGTGGTQMVETSDLPLSTIKKRGHPKRQDLTAMELPMRKKRRIWEFSKKSNQEKQDYILNLFVNSQIVKDAKNGKIVEESDVETISGILPHSVFVEDIDFQLIKNLCTEGAFRKIIDIVEQKRIQPC